MKRTKHFRESFFHSLKKLLLIMRFAAILLILGILQAQAIDVYSQKTRLSINFSDAELIKVLDKIEVESEFFFLYDEKLLNTDRKVNVTANDQLINVILDNLFAGTEIKYTITDRKIILAPIFLSEKSEVQQRIVSGTVTTSDGKPVPGVTVRIKGISVGALTDDMGRYSLADVPQNATLLFSFIGMETQEILSDGRGIIDVILKETQIGLDEVVVIGYGTQKKVNVIGSVTTVATEELNTAPVSMISNALAGLMPGTIVEQGSGQPGNNAAVILIRGQATLGDNSPLIVVDGIPGRDMNSLQPTDIESITVLKDASAAIYGARAANGVILITTKRGSANSPATFTYGFYQGLLSPTKIPEMADAATYAQMIREMQSYRNIDESNMMFSLDDIEKYKSGKYPWTHPNTDWFAEGLKSYSTTSNHNLSVSGGTQAITYYGSFGTQSDNGIFKNSASSYKRYNIKATVNAKVNKYFSFGVDMNGSQENRMFPTRGEWNVFSMFRRSKPTDPAFYPNGLPGPDIEYGDNPVIISGLDPGYDNIKTYRLNTILSATLNVPGIKGLTLSSYYAYDKYFSVEKLWEKPFTLYSLDTQAYLNAGNDGSQDGSAFLIPNFPKGMTAEPRVSDSYEDSDNKVFNLKLNYDKSIGDVHNISAFISMESSDYLAKGISAFRRYFISSQLPYIFAGGTSEWTNDGFASLDSRLNYFGRVMYDYKGTYLLQFSLRRDGSLRFSKESGRWGTFPSILAGWRISNEDFWKNNVKFIDYFKLKASFGQMGNDQVEAFQYLTSYAFGTGMVFGSNIYSAGLEQSGSPNPLITWEVANIFNVGFESAMLDDRLTFNTDFFYQRRSNILVKRNASVPDYTGISLPDENFGIVDNKGFELELGYNEYKGDFSYSINGNLAFARNKIIEFDEPERNVPWQVRTGHPQGALLRYKSEGIFRDEEQVNSMPHVSGARPGDIIIKDYDKDGEITSDDRILFDKVASPEITFGILFNLGYKNWNLRGLIQGAGTTMRDMTSDSQTGSIGNYYAYEAEDRWTVDNIDATKPRAYEREEEYWRSDYATDYNYQKSGYGRLKNLQLSYSLPKRILNVILIKDAQVYVSGHNLLLIYTQNKILDPELSDMSNYPIMKVYTVGVKVAF